MTNPIGSFAGHVKHNPFKPPDICCLQMKNDTDDLQQGRMLLIFTVC
jgi:hypothetical protein